MSEIRNERDDLRMRVKELEWQVERLTQELAVANEHARKMTSERDITLIEGGKQVRTLREALETAKELISVFVIGRFAETWASELEQIGAALAAAKEP